ncbi:MAG TPA: hypothetical protein VFW96_02285 [Thermomicrobiales bacterium]|nr:hypothetical protein [Thermomicrobiales bacterium]
MRDRRRVAVIVLGGAIVAACVARYAAGLDEGIFVGILLGCGAALVVVLLDWLHSAGGRGE